MPASALSRFVRPLDGGPRQFDPIFERIGDAHTVLIGEASHGTHEFYAARAAITRQLITEHGFAAVVIEGDWPDVYRLNRFVRGDSDDATAVEALADFERFPIWMWRNRVVAEFADWLRRHDEGRPSSERAGIYGMDLYSLYRSIAQVLTFLDEVDPAAAARARERYACFEAFEPRAELYGRAAGLGLHPSCERIAIAQLVEMRSRIEGQLQQGSIDERFYAEQNAALVRSAERYYRSMMGGRVSSWNLRDRHMLDTCEALREHLTSYSLGPRLVIWAHNSHVGDARASEWAEVQQVNLGQLMRERHDEDEVVLIGFTTHLGTVTAADNWDEPAQTFMLRPSLASSWERAMHETEVRRGLVITREAGAVLHEPRLHRAVGVIYRPQTERQSHYFMSRLGHQYDVILHYDETRALQPLQRSPIQPALHEPAETYPFGV